MSTPEPGSDRELRYAVAPITRIDVRDPSGNDDNTWTMSGYAAVFGQDTTLYDGKFLKLTESIDSRAFDDVLENQPMAMPGGAVHFNFGHDMNRAVAATDVPAGQPGSLMLRADPTGLHFLAKVPRDDPDGVAMASKMRTGVLKQASFAFTVADDANTVSKTDDGVETEHRTILQIGKLFDVCATPQGAYSQTVAQLRSLAAAIGQPEREATIVNRESGGEIDVSPEPGGVVESRQQRETRMRMAAARRRFRTPME